MPRLSVIIPTHKRAAILRQTLAHLAKQTIAGQLEVIVISDGQDRETAAQMENRKCPPGCGRTGKMEHYYFEVPKSQQGMARNEGVKHAQGEYVLFIGDDIFLAPDACERHLKAHESYERLAMSDEQHPLKAQSSKLTAVLGFTTWDPACGITPVMKWLERSGWQFQYPALSRYAHGLIPEEIQHQFTYTSHISLPLSLAKKHPFRPDVHLYGWEDIEWGMRLRDAGVRLFYEPDAKALHHHHLEMADSLRRMEILGQSAVEIATVVPGFDRVPRGWKLPANRLLSLLPTMAGRHRRRFLAGISR